MAVLARWCFRHRWVVVGAWLVLLVVLGGLSRAVGTAYSDQFNLPGTESTRALTLLQRVSPASAGDTDEIVLHARRGSLRDADLRARVSAMLAKVAAAPQVASVVGPYSAAGAAQLTRDGRIGSATVTFARQAQDLTNGQINRVVDLAEAARSDALQVELGGQAIEQVSQTPPSSSEAVGVLAAGVILFVAFGSLFAMLLPLITAIGALGVGLSFLGLLSHGVSLGTISPTLAALIGLGVGIDYALFIVTRYRTGLLAGLEPEPAAVRALDTSGRAVLFAGGTVCIALLGLLVLRVSFLAGMGIAAAITVVFTMAAAVTLTPALLGVFGVRILSRRQRRKLAAEGAHIAHTRGFWASWAGIVQRRGNLLSIAAVAVIALLAVPFFSLRLGSSDAGSDPAGSTTRRAYDLLADGFGPGSNGPLQLVAELPAAGDRTALTGLTHRLASVGGVAQVAGPVVTDRGRLGIVTVVPTSSPQSQATNDLISRLRGQVVPAAERGTSMTVYVGGVTAIYVDFAHVLTSKLPLFLAVIVVLGCLLLLVAFRSIVVPLTAAVMNLLAAAASFGVVVAVFQWGWLGGLIGISGGGPVEAFLPVIMLAILFGLSMDYQVFLVSRMHEEWTHSRDNARAVRTGQADTGRVITAAATIMICVFVAFVFGGQRVIAEFGIGLSSAVAIDAFILRTVLVPSLMHLLGTSNWWLPGWLDRLLPHLSVEPADEPPAPAGTPVPQPS